MTTLVDSKLLTAEEYGRLPGDGRLTELVRGRIVELNRPYTSHGYLVLNIGHLLIQFVKQHDLGRIGGSDAGVITRRNPDSVRGPDLAFYSYERIPRGPRPEGYWSASPELVIEIRSQSDRWKDILQKVAEYLSAEVLTVAVIDPESQRVHVYSADKEATILSNTDRLTFPDILPGFEVGVESLFE
ncbi:MAG: Uma2 family endonuclease [Planctomycetaceae bacterium]|nr:Uma2 family endonuclease [Planctomycetaceae bacterium]